MEFFEFFERDEGAGGGVIGDDGDGAGEEVGSDPFFGGEDGAAFDDVAEFADISGPRVALEEFNGFGVESEDIGEFCCG